MYETQFDNSYEESETEPSTDISPEEKLWRNVVLTYFFDLQKAIYKYQASTNGLSERYWRDIEGLIFDGTSDWMKEICTMAGINFDAMKYIITDVICGKKKINLIRRHDC